MPQFGRPDSDNMNEDRIHHILTEASSMIQKPMQPMVQPPFNHHHHSNSMSMKHLEDSHSVEDSKSPPNCTSPFGKRNSNNMKKYENDDISEEKLQKIYQEEFHKIMARSQRDSFPK